LTLWLTSGLVTSTDSALTSTDSARLPTWSTTSWRITSPGPSTMPVVTDFLKPERLTATL
jgi:hypothetical protein